MDAPPFKRMVGRYCLYRPLASGGTATVYLGSLRSEGGFSRAVAIKKLHEHFAKDARLVAALLDEARIVSRIRHPNVVSVLDVVVEEGEQLLVLEYVHGESLSQLMAPAPSAPAPLPVAMRILADALEGLHAAHEATSDQGVPLLVVHRDVSPQNIMVDTDGRSRIVDFGIAKALERPYTTVNTDEFRGKLAYATPEQISGAPVDRRTDVWAAGVVLWELIAHRRFFVDALPPEIVHRIAHVPAPPPSSLRPDCPPALDALVGRALERDPELRFGSAREMALALEKIGPMADHREVGRWMRKLARPRLEERTQLLAEMETELRRSPPALTPGALAPAPAPAVEEAISASPVSRSRRTLRWRLAAGIVLASLGVGLAVRAPRLRADPGAVESHPSASALASAPASTSSSPSDAPLEQAASAIPSGAASTSQSAARLAQKRPSGPPPRAGGAAGAPLGARPPAGAPRPPRPADPLGMDDRK